MKNLTTGEMIDRLRTGDTAKNASGEVVGYDEAGKLVTWYVSEEVEYLRDTKPFEVTEVGAGTDLWTIEPKFVSFQEAQDALVNEKKSIIFYQEEELQYKFSPGDGDHFTRLASDSLQLEELVKGKWIVINHERKN